MLLTAVLVTSAQVTFCAAAATSSALQCDPPHRTPGTELRRVPRRPSVQRANRAGALIDP